MRMRRVEGLFNHYSGNPKRMRIVVLQRRVELLLCIYFAVVISLVSLPVFTTPWMMADDAFSHNANKDKLCLNKVNDQLQHRKIIGHIACSMSTLVRMVEKSCRSFCQLLCCSTDKDNLLCDRLAICPGKKELGHTEEPHITAADWNLPSTILIVNISNSTLIDCVIGNETCAPTVAEKQPLMRGTIQDLHEPSKCSCSPQNIEINSSNLSCVIIGDNNYMEVEQTVPSEEENGENIS